MLKTLITSMLLFLICLFSNYSYANEEYYTIQAGSYPSIAEAKTEPLKGAIKKPGREPVKAKEPAEGPALMRKEEVSPQSAGIQKEAKRVIRMKEESGKGSSRALYFILPILLLIGLVALTRKQIISFLEGQNLAAFFKREPDNSYPLYPDMVQDVDPRYAARNLRDKFMKIVGSTDIQQLPVRISSDELKEKHLHVYDEFEAVSSKITAPMIILRDLELRDGARLLTEAYVKGNAVFGDAVTIKALAVDGEIRTGRKLRVLRWVDSGNGINIGEESNLGMSVTTEGELFLGRDCLFKVIYGRPVRTCNHVTEAADANDASGDLVLLSLEDMDISIKPLKNKIWFTKDEFIIPSGVRVFKNLVTTSNLTIRNASIIHGYLKAHKNIFIQDNASVKGDVTAYNDLYIGKNVRVYGNIYARGRTYLDCGTRIGEETKIISAFSMKSIEICENVEIHGLAFTNGTGSII